MKKNESAKGFTLVELVVVIAILGILAGIAIPRFMEATKESKKVTCLANRTMIERSFHLAQVNNEYTDLTTFLEAIKTDETVATKYFKDEPICPSGGTYSVSDDDHVVCSVEYHQDTVSDDSESDGTGDAGDTGDTGDTGGSDTGDTTTTVDTIKTSADGSWQEALDAAAASDKGGIKLVLDDDGNQVDSVLYEQYGEYYLIFNDKYLDNDLGVSQKALSEYAKTKSSVVQVDFDAPMLTSDDYTTTEDGSLVWKSDSIPSAGDIYQDGDDYYVRKKDSTSIWTALDVTDLGQWAKL